MAISKKEKIARMQAGRKTVDANETTKGRFSRLVNRRVPRAIKALAAVGNLSNRASYEYTPEQVAKIEALLTKALDNALSGFTARGKGADDQVHI